MDKTEYKKGSVGELRDALKDVPDDYIICSRSCNASLGNNIQFARKVNHILIMDDERAVMLIGGWG